MAFLLDQLSLLGLNEREVRVFVALATFGRMNMAKTARRAGLSRTTVDAIVRRLTKQRLLTYERIGGHLEYSVPLGDLATTLTSVGARFSQNRDGVQELERMPADMDQQLPHTNVYTNPMDALDQMLEQHAGERARMLLRGGGGVVTERIKNMYHVFNKAVREHVKLEVLLCTHTADMLRGDKQRIRTVDSLNILLNIVPPSYCVTAWDVVIFRDSVFIYNERQARTIAQQDEVDIVSHLLTVACETGWSVRLQAWLDV